jgi:hypothetical protein
MTNARFQRVPASTGRAVCPRGLGCTHGSPSAEWTSEPSVARIPAGSHPGASTLAVRDEMVRIG